MQPPQQKMVLVNKVVTEPAGSTAWWISWLCDDAPYKEFALL